MLTETKEKLIRESLRLHDEAGNIDDVNYMDDNVDELRELLAEIDRLRVLKYDEQERLISLNPDTADIYYNNSESPIFIITKYSVDPLGGPAIHENAISVAAGEGIDLKVLGLSRKRER